MMSDTMHPQTENQVINDIRSMFRSNLKEMGYFKVSFKSENESSINIEADGNMRSIRVLVSLDAKGYKSFSKDEIKAIKTKAFGTNREPWLAFVKTDNEGRLMNSIEWKNLS